MRRSALLLILILSFINSVIANAVFEENKGQWSEEVLFRAHIPGGYLYLTQDGLKYFFVDPDIISHSHTHSPEETRKASELTQTHQTVKVQFLDSNPLNNDIEKINPSIAASNYFIGNDPAKWKSGVKKYNEIRINHLYPGIHLRLYEKEGQIKYDFEVDKGGAINDIRIRYMGVSSIAVEEGQLKIKTLFGTLIEDKPISFQSINGRSTDVKCQYELNGNVVSFRFPDGYNKQSKLTIDPALIFSSYSGSTADNWGFTATFDDRGNLYSGGIVRAIGFPTQTGVFQENYSGNVDVGLLKFDSTGTKLLYATYLGGDEAETPQSLIVNSKNELVIYGTTSSADFPVTANAFQKSFMGGVPMDDSNLEEPVGSVPFNSGSDLYVAKLDNMGENLVASSFIGGTDNDGITLRSQALTKNYGDQFRGEVIVDEDDNIYIASNTTSTDFPVVNGFQDTLAGGSHDGVVVKLAPEVDSIVWSTYLGGSGMDAVYAIRIDSSRNVFVAGGTDSPDYPITPGVLKFFKPNTGDIDAVVTHIRNDGTGIINSTFLGTDAYDQAYLMDIDSSQNVYILGQTSGSYPVTAGVYSNANSGQFIHKISYGLDSTYFSTTIGNGSGGPNIRPTAFLVNECENIFISGWGGATNNRIGYIGGNVFNMPITADALQSSTDGSDFYLMVLLKDAEQLLYGSYFGGNFSQDHVDGGTSRFDKRGIVYQSVCASCGGFNDFPTTPGAWSSTNNSQFPIINCNNAVFKFDMASLRANFTTDSHEFDDPGVTSGCYPLDIVFLNRSLGGEDFEWDLGEGTVTNQEDSIYITYEDPGIYDVSLEATDINTCTRVDYAYGQIEVFRQNFQVMEPDSICSGESIQLFASGANTYQWQPETFLNNPKSDTPLASPDTTTYFKVHMVDNNNCEYEDSVLIDVVPSFYPSFEFQKINDCEGHPVIAFKNTSQNAESYEWVFGDGETSEEFELQRKFNVTDSSEVFDVTLKAFKVFCEKSFTKSISSVETYIPNVITPGNDEKNESFIVVTDMPVDLKVFNRWGFPVYEKENYDGSFSGNELSAGVYFYEITFQSDDTVCQGWLHILR